MAGVEQRADLLVLACFGTENRVDLVEEDCRLLVVTDLPKQVGGSDVHRLDRVGHQQLRYLYRSGLPGGGLG